MSLPLCITYMNVNVHFSPTLFLLCGVWELWKPFSAFNIKHLKGSVQAGSLPSTAHTFMWKIRTLQMSRSSIAQCCNICLHFQWNLSLQKIVVQTRITGQIYWLSEKHWQFLMTSPLNSSCDTKWVCGGPSRGATILMNTSNYAQDPLFNYC